MYRNLYLVLLCMGMALSAPQQNSNITFVKRQSDLEYSQPILKASERESRIENLPLIIPGNVSKEDKSTNRNTNESTDVQPTQANEKQPIYNYSDRIYSIKTKSKKNNSTIKSDPSDEVDNKSEIKPDIVPSVTEDLDIVPAESILSDRVATNGDALLNDETGTTEGVDIVTEKYEEDPTVNTEADEITTKAPSPRFLPKLSYFGKSSYGSFSQNLIEPGKRKFRSRCRCEKIWNCAKLQISVPRCPEEYFMCCA